MNEPPQLELVLGTAQFIAGYGVSPATAEEGASPLTSIFATAARLGIAALDTAPAYGDAEVAIGEAGCTIAVHTKIDPALAPAQSLERSLGRLRRESVDVLYLHDSTEVLRQPSAVIAAAAELVGTKVARLGASVYDVAEFEAAVADPRITVVQVPLNLFDRRFTGQRLAAAATSGTTVYVRSVLLQGVLVARSAELPAAVSALRPYVAAFEECAESVGRSQSELAFGWVKAIRGIRGVVIGVESPRQLCDVVESFTSPVLDDEVRAVLEAIPLPPPELCDPRLWPQDRSRG